MSNSTLPLPILADIDPPVSTTSSLGVDGSTTSAAPTTTSAAAVTTSSTSAAAATTSAPTSAAQTSAAAATSSAAAAASSSSAAAAASSARTTAAPTSAARTTSVPVVLITITSTDSSGALVTGVSSSSAPASTGTAGSSSSGSGSSSNLGAIIGGVAGGVAGLIILIWLILLPLRRRAKKQKEVEWLAFGQENDHVNESSAEAIYGRGAGGGGGEGKGGSVANVNEIQMDEMADQPYHYQNVAAHSPSVQQQPGQYDAYYGHPQQAYGGPQYQQPMHYPQQQQQQWAGSQPQYSPEAAWGAAPGYVSPTAQSINHGGLSHSMSVGSKAPAPESQHYSQDGHGQYGYASPPLGPHSPQQYPQQYQGQPQPYAAAVADAASQRSGSPQSVQHDRRPGNTGLHLANP